MKPIGVKRIKNCLKTFSPFNLVSWIIEVISEPSFSLEIWVGVYGGVNLSQEIRIKSSYQTFLEAPFAMME